jgi:hypothetical protein
MEKRLNNKLEKFLLQMKEDVRAKISELYPKEKPTQINNLMEFVYEYERIIFDKDDFIKRKRVKNSIPHSNRCSAKRANGEQCTRRRRDDCEFCGTHYKGAPHGLMSDQQPVNNTKQVEIFAEDVSGIIYYMDKQNNVYKITDILEAKENPSIIGKYVKNGNEYKINLF